MRHVDMRDELVMTVPRPEGEDMNHVDMRDEDMSHVDMRDEDMSHVDMRDELVLTAPRPEGCGHEGRC